MTVLSFALLVACKGGGNPDDSGGGSSTTDPQCDTDDACQPYQICNDGGFCEDGDRNNEKEDAVELLWEDPESTYLNSSSDEDWFKFVSEGEEWVRVQTTCADSDTLVELYSPAGKLHASEDNHPLGSVSTYDTVLVAYLPTAGDYLIKVTGGAEAEGAALYDLELKEFSAVTSESDSLDSPSLELELRDDNINNLGVVIDSAGDADWIEYSITPGAQMYIAGSSSARDSDLAPLVELMLPDGTPLLSKVEPTPGDRAIQPILSESGTVLLKVSDAAGGGGPNHWASLHSYEVGWFDDYGVDAEPNDNQGQETALSVEMDKDESDRDRGTSRGMGFLDDGDVDRFSVEVLQDNYVYVNGTSDGYGSLLLDAQVRVLDAAGQVVAEGEVDADQDSFADVAYFGPLDAGTYVIEVSSLSGEGGPGSFYIFSAFQKNLDE